MYLHEQVLCTQKYTLTGVVEDIFKIGSMASGAMLYEASREFQVRSSLSFPFHLHVQKKLLDITRQSYYTLETQFFILNNKVMKQSL